MLTPEHRMTSFSPGTVAVIMPDLATRFVQAL
jgi:hypothetical protein